jgi:hypothetical protein
VASLLAAAVCLGGAAVSSAAAPRLQLVGNHLVEGRTGQVFVPRGVNWPSFEYACENGYGYSNPRGPGRVGPDATGAARIARWNINTVRLPLNQDCWLGEDGLPAFGNASGYRAAVRRWVSTLHRAGLAVVLDLHWSGPAGVASDGQRPMADDRSDDFWRSVARAFKKDRSLIYDVFNEPYGHSGDSGLIIELPWDCWRSGGCKVPRARLFQPFDGTTFTTIGMQSLVDAIRSTGARQPIMLSGRHFGNDLGAWAANRPTGRRLIASFHNYDFQPCDTVACWDATVAPLARRVPVVAGEFGQIDCSASHVKRFMRWADRRGVGYLMWAWWVLPDPSCSSLVMLADAKGRARAPNGTALKAHLAALAPRFSLGGPRTQALDAAVELEIRCRKRCHASTEARLRVASGREPGAASRTFRLRPSSKALRAGRTRTLALAVPPAARQAATAALLERRAVTAAAEVTVTDGSHTSVKRRSVRLRG